MDCYGHLSPFTLTQVGMLTRYKESFNISYKLYIISVVKVCVKCVQVWVHGTVCFASTSYIFTHYNHW